MSAKNKIVEHDEWIKARKEVLRKEKEFSQLRVELSKQIRELPWEKVDKEYVFDGPEGKETLSDLFEGRNQLVIYHFMFGEDWTEGCPSCSMLADHYDPAVLHLNQRNVTMATVSRSSLDKLQGFKKRMAWNFKWVFSLENDFNADYHVSFTPEPIEKKEVYYNYGFDNAFQMPEPTGISVFDKEADGVIYHTYSTYARGLDSFLGVYRFLDLVPKGRNESNLEYPMVWVRHHDKYGDTTNVK